MIDPRERPLTPEQITYLSAFTDWIRWPSLHNRAKRIVALGQVLKEATDDGPA